MVKRSFTMGAFILMMSTGFVSCKRDGAGVANNSNYLTAVVGGTSTQFNIGITAHKNDDKSISIQGSTSTGTQANKYLNLSIFGSSNSIAPGTYTISANNYNMTEIYGTIQNGTTTNYTASTGSSAPEDAFEIVITSIDAARVTGTFSGKMVIVNGLTTVSTIDVVQGKFSAPIE